MPEYSIQTPNFSYVLQVVEKRAPFHTLDFTIAEKGILTFSASLFLPDIDEQFKSLASIVTFHTTDIFEECALDDTKQYGKEVLYSFLHLMKTNYPHIHLAQVSDSSHIPKKGSKSFDLLTYRIAMYGKTWYEEVAGAYLAVPDNQQIYSKDVQTFMSPFTKRYTSFVDIYRHMIHNPHMSIEMESLYDASETFSEFFQKIAQQFPDTVNIFQYWLDSFVRERVYVLRNWTIDIQYNDYLTEQLLAYPTVKM